MKLNSIYLIFILLFTTVFSCTKSPETPEPVQNNPFAEAHKYFPQDNGNKWLYELTIIDENGQKTLIDETAIYSKDSQAVNFYRNGNLWSWMNWSNVGSTLSCCGGRILLDYNLIDCTSDSVLIYSDDTSEPIMWIYQICDKFNTLGMSEYDSLDCIKTSQYNTYNDGSGLNVINYFGHNVGLIYRHQTTIDVAGNVVRQETLRLKSHSF